MATAKIMLDLEPEIRRAMSRINVEVDRRVAHLAAAEMRKLGWVCIPPEGDTVDW